MKDPENAKVIDELMRKRLQPTIPSRAMNTWNPNDMIWEYIRAFQFWLPAEIDGEKWGMVSGLYLVISRIVDVLMLKMQQCWVDIMVIVRIMMGLMVHEYYTTGEYGEKLRDLMDEEYEKREKGEETPERGLLYFWTNLVPFNTESASPRWQYSQMVIADFYSELIKDKKEVKLSPELLKAAYITSINQPELLKFDKEWIALVKRKFPDRPDIVKGFQQQRIKRKWDYYVSSILTSIVAAIYQEEELFLYFDPYYFDMGICDRKHLTVMWDHINLVMSFTNILNSIFCPHCIKQVFGKYDIDFSIMPANQASDIIKQMFDEVYNQVSNVCPDDITLTVEWKIDDKEKFSEVDKALPYGQVWFDKYADEKKWVAFKVQKSLKDYKKKIE